MHLFPAFCPWSALQTVATEGRSGILSFSLLNMYLYLKLCLYLYLRFQSLKFKHPGLPHNSAGPTVLQRLSRMQGEAWGNPHHSHRDRDWDWDWDRDWELLRTKLAWQLLCSMRRGQGIHNIFWGPLPYLKLTIFRTHCFPSKVDEGGCAESRVSYCRLPSPHTTCRLTQVVLGYLSSLDNFRQLGKNANH